MQGRRVELNFRDVATSVHAWKREKRVRIFHLKSKMHLPADLIRIVTSFAWNRSFTDQELHVQLDCCIDCQLHIPPWFLEDVIYCFPKRHRDHGSIWTLKFYNPLVSLNRRSCEWLFLSITPEYLRRKRMHRKPLTRLLDLPINDAWPKMLERIGDRLFDSFWPHGLPSA